MKKLLLLIIIPFLSFGQITKIDRSYNLIKNNWESKFQFDYKNQKINYWHTLEHAENDSTFWNNVDINKLYILINNGYNEADLLSFLQKFELTIIKRGPYPEIMNYILVNVKDGHPNKILKIVKSAKNNIKIKGVEPSPIAKSASSLISSGDCWPNDPYYGADYQWGPWIMYADYAWCYEEGGDAIIGVIDGSCDYTHPELQDNVVYGYNFTEDNNNILPSYSGDWHGTHVTGTISAKLNNGSGISGMSNNPIYFAKVGLSYEPEEPGTLNFDATLDAVQDMAMTSLNIKVINMSLGLPTYDFMLHIACNVAYGSGKLLIASSGNTGNSQFQYPASYLSVVSVGSIEPDFTISPFSTYNDSLELVGPGGEGGTSFFPDVILNNYDNIYSTLPPSACIFTNNCFGTMYGTSMAAPHITGLAGLMFSANPCITNEQVRTILQQNTNDLGNSGWDILYGYGLPLAHYCVLEAILADCNNTMLQNFNNKYPKQLIKKIDILGRETTNKGFQLHIYDDGSVEKKYLIK